MKLLRALLLLPLAAVLITILAVSGVFAFAVFALLCVVLAALEEHQ